ncbi:MAG: periplasmic binding protein [Rariglobus sp.]|jgi:iron complex transport system substrate-binding protein|nr:periplasmic binding protein [Rariglobus sp.]
MFRLFILLCLTSGLAHAAPAARVVSQTVGTDELLLALARPEQIAALSHISTSPEFSPVAAEAKAYPSISMGDSEAILRHRPTLVLFADYSRSELVAQVRKTGVRVIIFDRYATLADVYGNLRTLGRELGREARAEELIAACETRMAVLKEKLKGVKPVRVVNASTYGLLSGAGTTFQDLCDHAGAENLATTLGGMRGVAPEPSEKMLVWPIDAVVLGGDGTTEAALAPLREILPYRHIDAVRKGRAIVLPSALLATVSHHRIEAYERLARGLHPEAMK